MGRFPKDDDMQILFRPSFQPGQLPLIRAPRGDDAAEAIRTERAAAAEKRWMECFPADDFVRDEECDFEDFHENAAQLFAAIDQWLPVFVLERSRNVGKIVARFHTQADFDPEQPFALIGSQIENDEMRARAGCSWPRPRAESGADRYFAIDALKELSGRYMRVVGADPKNAEATAAVIEAARWSSTRGRGGDVVIKNVAKAKGYPLAFLQAVDPADPDRADRAVIEALDFQLARYEGDKEVFLVQERIDMRREYRVVVVDGKPVAGAGCVETMTPLDHGSHGAKVEGAFDCWMEDVRRDGKPKPQPGTALAYRAAAIRFIGQLRGEKPELLNFTLDLCQDGEDGLVRIVELNPLENFGFYAMDVAAVMKAIFAAAARMGPAPQPTLKQRVEAFEAERCGAAEPATILDLPSIFAELGI